MNLKDKTVGVLGDKFLCDNCLGRIVADLLSGYSNEQRGKILRTYLSMLIDSGEDIKVKPSNLHGIKFRNVKLEAAQVEECFVCKDFFVTRIEETVSKIIKRVKDAEFDTFLVGSVLNDEMLNAENYVWEKIGAETAESIKSEINREVGKRMEKMTGKKFDLKTPDVTIVVDLKNDRITISVKSLYIAGAYKKFTRGIPQTKWLCFNCHGKGCIKCKGKGKLYPISVQEIIEKPLLKAADGKKSSFHGSGREDIDARCLDWRPFIIEMIKPVKRKMDLKKIQKQINKSNKVNVKGLEIIGSGKDEVRKLKDERLDKTYLAEITFSKKIDRSKLKGIKTITENPILQRTPIRVAHRRGDRFRKRLVKKVSWKLEGDKKMLLKVRTESGLYIKELITGDNDRTKPNVAAMLNNKVKKISLDVIKIHVNKIHFK